jgi:hypothetical protein
VGGTGGGGTGGGDRTSSAGVANTGGGGGGTEGAGQNGGSGVVILKFRGKTPSISVGLTYSSIRQGSDRVLIFKSGTGTVTWS